MNLAGWIIMTASVGSVCVLTAFCFYRVLTAPEADVHIKGPLLIDTGDTDNPD